MITALKFFFTNLGWYYSLVFNIILFIHVSSHKWQLDAERKLLKNLPLIMDNNDDDVFLQNIFTLFLNCIFYLLIYIISMIMIEKIGKIAVKNASIRAYQIFLNIDLQFIKKIDYEKDVSAIVHHSENVSLAIHNMFVEFPKKVISSIHFIFVLQELSTDILLYCIIVSIIFICLSYIISNLRKNYLIHITNSNIELSLVSADLSNSIQSYKIDDRIKEYQNKINTMIRSNHYYSNMDTLMIASNDLLSNLSGHIMIALVSYTCRKYVLSTQVGYNDIMYGIRSSIKFIEKISGIFEYFSDVIRQYQSFQFFISCNKYQLEIVADKKFVKSLKIYGKNKIINLDISHKVIKSNKSTQGQGMIVKIVGPNGAGKTTMLNQLMAITHKGATSNGKINCFDKNDSSLKPLSYRNFIPFVGQNNPSNNDTVGEYIMAVSKCVEDPIKILTKTLHYLNIENNIKNEILEFFNTIKMDKLIKELSGGQAKFLQIITIIIKQYILNSLLLVLDEPTNNLDINKVIIVNNIIKCCIKKYINIIIITHDHRVLEGCKFHTVEL